MTVTDIKETSKVTEVGTPFSYFKNFFAYEMIEKIVDETNLYSE